MDLLRFRRMNDLSAAKACKELGVSRSALSRYENGERFPRPEILLKIKAMTKGQVMPDDFISGRSA